ncbi:MAG: BrnA antitoxin family protein [Alcaligenaceae bacterium]|nr:BrnA antitoxin family protein [Alcaligenaceae bacterium]
MQASRALKKSQTDWARVRREAAADIEPALDEDSPDAATVMREAVTLRRAGRPKGSGNKEQVSIRFDQDVLAAFRATGPGWQTRMNDALKEWLRTHSLIV